MPPYMYWPSDEAEIVFRRRSAFKNRVLKEDILDVPSSHPTEVEKYKGTPSKWDVVCSGGKMIVRPTMAVALVSGGRLLEFGFRQDFREPGEVCSVFHAR